MDPDQQLRNLRDFLLVYNRMTEICFQRCTSNFNYRNLTMDEERCVDSCAGKLIRSNHRLMGTYVQLMPRMMQRRMEELETKAAENAKAAEAAAASYAAPPATEALPASQTPVTSSLPPQVPPLPTSSVTDVGPGALGSMDVAVSKSTEGSLSAATALTPTEAAYPSVFNGAGNGPSYASSHPQPPTANPASISVDVPVSTVAASTLSKPTESMSGQERAAEPPPPSGQ